MGAVPQPLAGPGLQAALAAARKRPPQEVLIAGGGIGGLSTALALAKHAIASHVLERRPAFAEEGAGIQIGPNGARILAHLGVSDHLRDLIGRPECIRVRDALTGRDLARLPLGAWIESRHGAPYWTVQRQDLHAALMAKVRAEPLVRLSMAAEAVEVTSGEWAAAVALESGSSYAGRALIAADGLWSDVRTSAFGSPAPRFAGHIALRSVLEASDAPQALRGPETGLWLAPGAHAVHYPVNAGRRIAIVVVLTGGDGSIGWGSSVDAGRVRTFAATAQFAAELRQLLSTARSWRQWALYTLPVPRRWTSGRIALLGDAAHPVLPFLAQGGVMALEDAIVIAECLARSPEDTPRALRDYERRRRARTTRVARASRANGRIYHQSGLLAAARNALLARLSGERQMARYDWLYGWRP